MSGNTPCLCIYDMTKKEVEEDETIKRDERVQVQQINSKIVNMNSIHNDVTLLPKNVIF